MVMPIVRRFTKIPDVIPKAGLPMAPIQWTVDPHVCYVPDVRVWISPRCKDVASNVSLRDLSAQALFSQYSSSGYSRGTGINGKPTLNFTMNNGSALNQGLSNSGANLIDLAFLSSAYYASGVAKITERSATVPAFLLAVTNAANAVVASIHLTPAGNLQVTHGATNRSYNTVTIPLNQAFIWEVSYAAGVVEMWIDGKKAVLSDASLPAPTGTAARLQINVREGAGIGSYQQLGEVFVSAKPVSAQAAGDRAARLAAQSDYWGIPLVA